VAGLLGGLFRNIAIETGLMLLLIPLVSYVLWKTPFGLRLRASGEKPSAAESLGVDVVMTRWIALISSGMLAGLGGAWLVTNIGKYQQGQEGLRGFLGLASVIFGNWKPSGVLVGSILFQFTESVRLQIGDEPSLAFVFAVGMVAIALGVMRIRKRSWGAGYLFLLLASGIIAYYFSVERVDDKLSATFPYLITLLVLIFSSKRLRPPAAIGLPWTRGQED
jgi:simple sugar transport system permease protein